MEASGRKPNLATQEDSPTVLIVGRDPILRNLMSSLAARGLDVEVAGAKQAVEAAVASAPDLLLLVGDAARNGGAEVLERLAGEPSCSVVPVLVVGAGGQDSLHRGFRHGVLGTLGRNLGCAEIAKQVARTVAELPERAGEAAGPVGEATLGELLNLLSGELRSGVLSLQSKGQDQQGQAARIVLRAGRPVGEQMDAFVERVGPRLAQAEQASYRFEESACARLDSLPPPGSDYHQAARKLKGRRLLVLGRDRGRVEALAQALRARGALVVAASGNDVDLERARSLDPEVLIIQRNDLEGPFANTADVFRQDLRMRWASVLVVPDEQLWPRGSDRPEIDVMAAKVAELTQADRDLYERALSSDTLDIRLEVIGPSRTLRVLASTGRTLRLSVNHPRAKVEIDLGDQLVAGAAARSKGEVAEELFGLRALAAFLALGTARVHVQGRTRAELTDIMSPADLTLAMASDAALPLRPSIPPRHGIDSIPREQVRRKPTQQLFAPVPVPAGRAALAPELGDMGEPLAAPAAPMSEAGQSPEHPNSSTGAAPAASGPMFPAQPDASAEAVCSEPRHDWSGETPTERFSLSMLVESDSAAAIETVPPRAREPRDAFFAALLRARTVLATAVTAVAKLVSLSSLAAAVRTGMARARLLLASVSSRAISVMALARGFPASTLSRATSFRPGWARFARFPGMRIAGLGRKAAGALPGRISQVPRNAIFFGLVVAVLAAATPAVWTLSLSSGEAFGTERQGQGVQSERIQSERVRSERIQARPGKGQPGQRQLQASRNAGPQVHMQPMHPPAGRHELAARVPSDDNAVLPAPDLVTDTDDDELWTDTEEWEPGAGPHTPRERRIERASHWVRLGHRLRRQGRLGMAEAHYLRALQSYSRYPRALVGLVKVHLQRKDAREAVRWAKKLVRRQPGLSFAHLLLGDAYALDGSTKSAQKHWRIASRRGNRVARQRLLSPPFSPQ